jgi:hypothetical protein
MCIICVELAKQTMTPTDARRALREMRTKVGESHAAEVERKLDDDDAAGRSPKP